MHNLVFESCFRTKEMMASYLSSTSTRAGGAPLASCLPLFWSLPDTQPRRVFTHPVSSVEDVVERSIPVLIDVRVDDGDHVVAWR